MLKGTLLGFLSKRRDQGSGDASYALELLSDLGIYSVKSNEPGKETIFALRDCYLDHLISGEVAESGVELFCLNAFEVERESFKLHQELKLLELSEARLSDEYLETFVNRPLQAALELATSDEAAAREELKIYQDGHSLGMYSFSELKQAESRFAERALMKERARIDLVDREIEIDGQKRKSLAERRDLEQRIDLNAKIRELHGYTPDRRFLVSWHSWKGAFLEEGDPICTLSATTES